MVDLHCHYLPGVDDGPESLPAALALAEAAAANGITAAVLTPHIFPGRWENRASTLRPAFEAFARAVRDAGIPISLYLGAEVRLLPDLPQLLEQNELPMIGRWNAHDVLLLELPDGDVPVGAMRLVETFLRRDVLPMIAHPERNRAVMRDIKAIEPFVRAGCLLQLTAASVCGWFGRPAWNASTALLDAGWVTAIATDAHNLRHRPPVLREARYLLSARYGDRLAELLTRQNPSAMVAARADAGTGFA